jgi:hypothetical protein
MAISVACADASLTGDRLSALTSCKQAGGRRQVGWWEAGSHTQFTPSPHTGHLTTAPTSPHHHSRLPPHSPPGRLLH